MAESKHISVPRPFQAGDITEWLLRFEICSKANGWDAAKKALKLPTLLEGEALAAWTELTEEEQADYAATTKQLKKKLSPLEFSSLEAFHKRKLRPGEALSMFLQDLKQMLLHAMPNIDETARNQLLLHQFLAGLPVSVSKQLRATADITTVDKALERARLLMAIDAELQEPAKESCSAAIVPAASNQELKQLAERVEELTLQVATLTKRRPRQPQLAAVRRCFYCNQPGHFQRNCPQRLQDEYEQRRCYLCGQWGHVEQYCQMQLNDNGAPKLGRGRPRQP